MDKDILFTEYPFPNVTVLQFERVLNNNYGNVLSVYSTVNDSYGIDLIRLVDYWNGKHENTRPNNPTLRIYSANSENNSKLEPMAGWLEIRFQINIKVRDFIQLPEFGNLFGSYVNKASLVGCKMFNDQASIEDEYNRARNHDNSTSQFFVLDVAFYFDRLQQPSH